MLSSYVALHWRHIPQDIEDLLPSDAQVLQDGSFMTFSSPLSSSSDTSVLSTFSINDLSYQYDPTI
jgi:hypothetical protein